MSLLETLAESDCPQGVTDISTLMGLTKSNVHRLLTDLQEEGYVKQESGGRRYELTLKIWELGLRVISRLDWQSIVRPFLEDLSERTGETAHLAILDKAEIIYIDKIEGSQPIQAYSRIGGRAPAKNVATGKALLAFNSKYFSLDNNSISEFPENIEELGNHEIISIRKQGFSVNLGEWRSDVGGIAGPIFDSFGVVIAAIGISGPIARFPANNIESIAYTVVDVAAGASRALGFKTLKEG